MFLFLSWYRCILHWCARFVTERFLQKFKCVSEARVSSNPTEIHFIGPEWILVSLLTKNKKVFYFRLGIEVFCNIPEKLFWSDFYKNLSMFRKLVSQATRRTFFLWAKIEFSIITFQKHFNFKLCLKKDIFKICGKRLFRSEF